jgi:pimeloyl-ACP methyl ester carboxylesterase
MEKAVRFTNEKGHTLHGILHLPNDPATTRSTGLLWLSAGQKVRQGAWRMNVAVARRLAAAGIPTLRFDYRGIGDSEGEARHGEMVMDLYGFIQSGGFRGDAIAAGQFLTAETGVRSLVLGGLCGGAITGLFAATTLPNVFGHVVVDLPVTISSSARQRYLENNAAELLRSRPGETDTVIALYLKKLADLGAWRRLLSGESDYSLLMEAARIKSRAQVDRLLPKLPGTLRRGAERLLHGVLPPVEPEGPPTPVDAALAAQMQVAGEVKNELVEEIFQEVLARGQRVRFVNSSSYHPTFMGYFGNTALRGDEARWRSRGVELSVVPETNHIFSLEHSQRALFEAVEAMVAQAA